MLSELPYLKNTRIAIYSSSFTMNISLRQLRVFVAVAEALSFTRAGDALGLPQSSVSTQLRELEDVLGLRLFDRHTRMLRLTEAGGEILPLARKTLADLDAVVGSSAELKTLGRGRVSIAASSLQAAMVLPRVMGAFAERHPGIKVELFDVSQDEVLSMVHSGAVDFGLGTAFGSHQELGMRSLWHENFFAVLPKGHSLATKRDLAWRDLLAEPLIGPRKGNPVRTLLDFALASEGLVLTLRHEVSLPLTIAGMVEGGLGIGILTSSMQPLAEALHLQLRPIHRPTIQREVVLVLHTGRSLSPAAKQFSDALIAWSRKLG
ncbi:HTH-type transcriptional activator CmpR [Variovorax sp. PBL-H6]|nr:HTH-type transcriptional activator CmpR [Variovorax sp. PBL-H6]